MAFVSSIVATLPFAAFRYLDRERLEKRRISQRGSVTFANESYANPFETAAKALILLKLPVRRLRHQGRRLVAARDLGIEPQRLLGDQA